MGPFFFGNIHLKHFVGEVSWSKVSFSINLEEKIEANLIKNPKGCRTINEHDLGKFNFQKLSATKGYSYAQKLVLQLVLLTTFAEKTIDSKPSPTSRDAAWWTDRLDLE